MTIFLVCHGTFHLFTSRVRDHIRGPDFLISAQSSDLWGDVINLVHLCWELFSVKTRKGDYELQDDSGLLYDSNASTCKSCFSHVWEEFEYPILSCIPNWAREYLQVSSKGQSRLSARKLRSRANMWQTLTTLISELATFGSKWSTKRTKREAWESWPLLVTLYRYITLYGRKILLNHTLDHVQDDLPRTQQGAPQHPNPLYLLTWHFLDSYSDLVLATSLGLEWNPWRKIGMHCWAWQ